MPEEWLARIADIDNSPSWFNRLVAKIRATLRTMFNIRWSYKDIRSCFIEAAVRTKPISVSTRAMS